MEQKEVLRVLLKHYTKIGLNDEIAKVIFDDEFEDIAEEIVKLFAIPVVSNNEVGVCPECGCNKLQHDYGKHRTCLNTLCDWQGQTDC